MRRLWWLVLLSACSEPLVVPTGSAELALPEVVRFAPTAISYSRQERVVLTNRARAPKTVTLSTAAPFSIERATVLVPGRSQPRALPHLQPRHRRAGHRRAARR
jgi:hypothetical protein